MRAALPLALVLLAACGVPLPSTDASDVGAPDAAAGDGGPVGDVPGLDVAPPDSGPCDPPCGPGFVCAPGGYVCLPVDAGNDVAADAPEASPDVPAEASSGDATGDARAMFPDLATEYASAMYQVLYAPCTSTEGCVGERSVVMGPTTCRVMRGTRTASFDLRACNPGSGGLCDQLTGSLGVGSGSPGSTVFINSTGRPVTSTATVAVEAGTRYFVAGTPRQSLHVQFAATATGLYPGATGIAGRSVAPDRGDIWLLGCPTD